MSFDADLPPSAPPYVPAIAERAVSEAARDLAPGVLLHIATDVPHLSDFVDRMRADMADPNRLELLTRAWPLAGAFLRAEFDNVTPGERGLGRMSTSPPRLGGRFRGQLANGATREALALPAEQTIIAGFLAGAAMQVNFEGGPFDLRRRALDELWRAWVPGIYAAMRGAGPTSEGLLAGALDKPGSNFEQAASAHGLLAGFRKKRAGETIWDIAVFYGQAGVHLHSLSTSIADEDF
jgi:hypothetical protein